MKCPHCLEGFHSVAKTLSSETDTEGQWIIDGEICPECKRLILSLRHLQIKGGGFRELSRRFVLPQGSQRPAPPAPVVAPYRTDYVEACAVLPFSAKASAALTRRCLQAVLKDKGGFNHHNLVDQIDAAISSALPSHLTESLHAVRQIGNFAAHPMKSTSSGEILEVEEGEAEWNLDVLDALFDFYFVQPDVVAKKKSALNAKLVAAGKPSIT